MQHGFLIAKVQPHIVTNTLDVKDLMDGNEKTLLTILDKDSPIDVECPISFTRLEIHANS